MAEETNDIPDFGQHDDATGAGAGLPNNNANPDEAAKEAANKAAAEKAAADAEIQRLADEAAANKGTQDNTDDKGDNNPEGITIGKETFKLDKEGNAVDETGKVVKTKAEIDILIAEQEAIDEPLVDVIQKKAGVIIKDDKGQPVKFEDTEEGMVQLGIALGKEFGKTEFLELVKADPEFEEFVEYKRNGGKLADFIQKKTDSWKAFKLDESNEQQLINVVTADLIAAGYGEEEAKQTAEMYKDTKRLKDFGKKAYERLVAAEENEEKERVENFKREQQEFTTRVQNHWNQVNEVITKGDLKGINIPETDKKAFFDYLSVAVDDKGNSKKTIERSKLPLEQLLQLDYLQFKGFNLNELVKLAVKTNNARSLRDRVKTHNSGAGGGEGIDKNKYQKPDDANITLENMGV